MRRQNFRASESPGLFDYIFAIIGGSAAGGVIGLIVICLFFGGLPHTGILSNVWLACLPGGLIGGLLGLKFPKFFTDLGRIILDHIIFRRW